MMDIKEPGNLRPRCHIISLDVKNSADYRHKKVWGNLVRTIQILAALDNVLCNVIRVLATGQHLPHHLAFFITHIKLFPSLVWYEGRDRAFGFVEET